MGGRGVLSASAMLNGQRAKAKKMQTEHASWVSVEEIANELGCSWDEASDFYDAIKSFTGAGYSAIRKDQREGIPNKKGEDLEKFISMAPQWAGGTTYRGINLKNDSDFVKATTVGEVIDINAGTASWSTDIHVSDNFAHNNSGHSVVFIHDAPTQKGTSIKNLSNFVHESEVLVSKDARYRVVSVSHGYSSGNHRTYVHVVDA